MSEQEYREFWATDDGFIYNDKEAIKYNVDKEDALHVIEYSAYQELEKQIEIYKKALDFYAAFTNWFGEVKFKGNNNFPNMNKDDWEQFNNHTIAGKRARQALKEVGEV